MAEAEVTTAPAPVLADVPAPVAAPAPAASAARPHPKVEQLTHWLPLYLQKTDATAAHLNRILSSASGTDSLLTTVHYASILVASTLSKVPASSALTSPLSTTTPLRLRALASLISSVRAFSRLWGLLGIYTWARSVAQNPPADPVLRRIATAQVVVNTAFQALENAAYLASNGIVSLGEGAKGQTRIGKAWAWSSRAWAAHVMLDLVKLARTRQLRLQAAATARGTTKEKGEKEVVVKTLEERRKEVAAELATQRKWTRALYVDVAYAPLTLHHSVEGGVVAEFWIGVLGTIAGGVGLLDVWERTA